MLNKIYLPCFLCNAIRTKQLSYFIYAYTCTRQNSRTAREKKDFRQLEFPECMSHMWETKKLLWTIAYNLEVRMGSFSIYKIKKRRKYALIGREYNILTETVRASNKRIIDIETRSLSLTWTLSKDCYPHVKCLYMTQITVTKYVSVS